MWWQLPTRANAAADAAHAGAADTAPNAGAADTGTHAGAADTGTHAGAANTSAADPGTHAGTDCSSDLQRLPQRWPGLVLRRLRRRNPRAALCAFLLGFNGGRLVELRWHL